MLGGRILGEGVDGCIMEKPMWPCVAGSEGTPDTMNSHYVSKIVSIKDEEAGFLKMAERLLGSELAGKYLARLQSECKPADSQNPPKKEDEKAIAKGKSDLQAWPKKGMACGDLKKKLELGVNISRDSKIMFISKYPTTVSGWAVELGARHTPYDIVIQHIDKAIPRFIFVLQKLFQNPSEQLIHIDLHTGNIFARFEPLEFGIADFGRCVFRRNGVDPSMTFFGEFLITYVSSVPFFCGYSQVPLEARLMSFCYMKKLDGVSPAALVHAWENDPEVRETSPGSCDIVVFHRAVLMKYLMKKILFIAMVETIQAICRRVRECKGDSSALYQSMRADERKIMEFILTRYAMISPINTITEEIMDTYPDKPLTTSQGVGSNNLVKFVIASILAPYDQDGSSLVKACESVQEADLGILWADIVRASS